MKPMKSKKNFFGLIFLIFLSGLLFFFDKKNWLKSPKKLIESPIIKAEEEIFRSYQGFLEGAGGFFHRPNETEIMSLTGEIRQLAIQQNQLDSCLEENERMRKLLGTPLPAKWKFIMSSVIGVVPDLKIDKGQNDGVKEGMMVISDNILVGKVIGVSESLSRVQRMDSEGVKIPVVAKKIGSPTGEGVQARGLLVSDGGQLILDRVLQNEDIQKSDLVVTSGEADWLPDLLIGRIEEVLPKTADVYRKARITPLVDYQSLRIVFIVLP